MSTEPDEQEAAREAGRRYGTMAAALSLLHISTATTEEKIQEHIADLARNIREQAAERARNGLGDRSCSCVEGCRPQGSSGPSGGVCGAQGALRGKCLQCEAPSASSPKSIDGKPTIALSTYR